MDSPFTSEFQSTVQQKMKLAGLDPSILENKNELCRTSSTFHQDMNLFANGKTTLKKIARDKRKSYIQKIQKQGHNAPSLQDIQATLAKLRKVNSTSSTI